MRNNGALALAAMVAMLLGSAACDWERYHSYHGASGTGQLLLEDNPDLSGSGRGSSPLRNACLGPSSYIDEATERPAGRDYDTWNEICAGLNCTPEFAPTERDGRITAVSAGVATTWRRKRGSRSPMSGRNRSTSPTATSRWSSINDDESTTLLHHIGGVLVGEYVVGTQIDTTSFETATAEYGDARVDKIHGLPFSRWPIPSTEASTW